MSTAKLRTHQIARVLQVRDGLSEELEDASHGVRLSVDVHILQPELHDCGRLAEDLLVGGVAEDREPRAVPPGRRVGANRLGEGEQVHGGEGLAGQHVEDVSREGPAGTPRGAAPPARRPVGGGFGSGAWALPAAGRPREVPSPDETSQP